MYLGLVTMTMWTCCSICMLVTWLRGRTARGGYGPLNTCTIYCSSLYGTSGLHSVPENERCTHTHAHTHARTHARMHTHTHAHTHMYLHTPMHMSLLCNLVSYTLHSCVILLYVLFTDLQVLRLWLRCVTTSPVPMVC